MVDLVDYVKRMQVATKDRVSNPRKGARGKRTPRSFYLSRSQKDEKDVHWTSFSKELHRAIGQVIPSGAKGASFTVRASQGSVEILVSEPEEMKCASAKGFDPSEAGKNAIRELQNAEGGAWTGAELLREYGLTPATLHKRRMNHLIVWWRDALNHFHYPKWQFQEGGVLLVGIKDVLKIFKSTDQWRVMRYFLTPKHHLQDQTPLALLRAGKAAQVVSHAKLHAKENTW